MGHFIEMIVSFCGNLWTVVGLLNISLRSVMYLLYFCLCCFQVKLSEKSSLLEKADGEISELAEKVNEQKKLIQKLEDDILKVRIDECYFCLPQYEL